MLLGNKIKLVFKCESLKIMKVFENNLMNTKHFSIIVGSSCPRQSLKGVGINLSGVKSAVNLIDGNFLVFVEC